MSSNTYAKIISEKWNIGRDIADVRKRNSTRLKELRRSNRSAVLNKFRQGLEFSEEKAKKTAVEEKLERLKAYKAEKQKKMEEIKKKQRPPFCSIVKARHTGGTPFRETELPANRKFVPLKKPNTALSSVRTRNKTQNLFEFKATLQDIKTIKDKNVAYRQIEKQEVKRPIPVKRVSPPSQQIPCSSSGVSKQRQQPTRAVAEKTTTSNKENNLVSVPSNGKKTTPPSREVNTKVINTSSEKKNSNTRNNEANKNKLDDLTNKVALVTTRTTRQTRGRPIPPPVSAPQEEKAPVEKRKLRSVEKPSQRNISDKQSDQDSDSEGRKKGADFHRTRLKNEIDRLTNEADIWSSRNEENIPELVKDEILAVVGQTRLLLSQKFKDFNNLIDRCEGSKKTDGLKVTLEDLEGFWDMMYREVMQLDQKYRNLQLLESNQWQEQVSAVNKVSKKVQKGKRKSKTQVTSKFKEFLKSKKQEQLNVDRPKTPELIEADTLEETNTGRPKTPDFSCPKGNEMDDSSFYHSANREDGEPYEIPDVLKTPKNFPDIQRTINSERRKSRRSSAGLIILRQRLLMKSISSPQKKNS